MAEGKEN